MKSYHFDFISPDYWFFTNVSLWEVIIFFFYQSMKLFTKEYSYLTGRDSMKLVCPVKCIFLNPKVWYGSGSSEAGKHRVIFL